MTFDDRRPLSSTWPAGRSIDRPSLPDRWPRISNESEFHVLIDFVVFSLDDVGFFFRLVFALQKSRIL